jgi:hypothetical protein
LVLRRIHSRLSNLTRGFDIQFLRQLILEDDGQFVVMTVSAPIANLCSHAFLLHQAINPVLATTLAQTPQVMGHLAIAKDPAAF